MRKLNRPQCPNPTALGTNYKHPDNKSALLAASHGKCMYCESSITAIAFAHVEHIKPKADSKYPELKFDWDNLGIACPVCNNKKDNKYEEGTPYINPYDEDPEEIIFVWGTLLRPLHGNERGALTIKDIDLNRPDLLEKRDVKIKAIEKALEACMKTKDATLREDALNQLLLEAEPDKEYSIFVAAFLKANGIS